MTEKETMLAGELYNSSDSQLVDKCAKKQCNKHNNLAFEDMEHYYSRPEKYL